MTQELRKLAEAVAGKYDQMKHTTEENMARARAFQVFSFAAANPAAILELLDRLEKAEKDAERYRFWRDKYPETFKPTDITPEDVDRLTDAAMEASK